MKNSKSLLTTKTYSNKISKYGIIIAHQCLLIIFGTAMIITGLLTPGVNSYLEKMQMVFCVDSQELKTGEVKVSRTLQLLLATQITI